MKNLTGGKGSELGVLVKKLGIGLINKFGADENAFVPRQEEITVDFELVGAGRKTEGVVGGSDQSVVEINTGRFGTGGGREKTSDFEAEFTVFKIETVAPGKDRNNEGAKEDQENDRNNKKETFTAGVRAH